MSKQKIILGGGTLLIIVLIMTNIMLIVSNNSATEEGEKTSLLGGLFGSDDVLQEEIYFINVPNIMITLNGSNSRTKHYLLMDLVLLAKSEDDNARIEKTLPLIKSATVNLLTHKDYRELGEEPVLTLRESLLAEYQKEYALLKIDVPFHDVMISKLVFQ